jgi:murein biosynthesis integral membrane protein MurJ
MQNKDSSAPKQALPGSAVPAQGDPVGGRAGSIIRATTVVTAIVLVVKAVGFVEKLLLAYFFGTGIEVDAYLVAYSLPFAAFIVLREVVKPAFLPTFLWVRQRAERDGWRLFAIIGTALALLLGAVTVVGVLLAEPLISLAAPGFAGEQRALAVQLSRIAIPALFLLGLSTLTTAVLHAQKRFALPALGDACFRAGPVVLLLVAAAAGGLAVGTGATRGARLMALGVLFGALGKLLVDALGLRRHLRWVRPSLTLDFPPVRTVARLAAPLLAALFLSLFVAPLVENAFASRVGVGGVSALAYARKVAETLTTILPYTLGLVLLPYSAEMAARDDTDALASTLAAAVRGLTFLFLPVTVGLMVLREPFVRLLFERGAFDAASTAMVAGPLFYYALALLPFSLEVVVIQFFFARQDTRTPVVTDIAAFVLNVALIPLLMPVLGLGGIALAAACAKGAKVLALLILFRRAVPAFRLGELAPFAGKMALASAVTAGILLVAGPIGRQAAADGGTIALAAYLAGAGILGGGGFVLVTYLLQVREVRNLGQRALGWFQGRVSG